MDPCVNISLPPARPCGWGRSPSSSRPSIHRHAAWPERERDLAASTPTQPPIGGGGEERWHYSSWWMIEAPATAAAAAPQLRWSHGFTNQLFVNLRSRESHQFPLRARALLPFRTVYWIITIAIQIVAITLITRVLWSAKCISNQFE